MKTIFICYNYLTLYKAIYNIRNIYKNDDCVIIYRTSVSELPQNIKRHFNIIEIKINDKTIIKPLKEYIVEGKWISLIKKTIKVIRKEVNDNELVRLVVFKDNEKMESTFIEEFKKFSNGKGSVVLIEEGIGLYLKSNQPQKLGYKYKILQKIFGLSKYFLNNYPQGYNPLVDKIVCSDVEKLNQIKGREGLRIISQKGIFTFDNAEFFLVNILGYKMCQINVYKSFKVVYLTQPTQEIGLTEENEEKIIKKLSQILGEKIIIKRHQRDNRIIKYKDNSKIFDFENEMSNIPFECIYSIMDSPIIVTFYSSAYANVLEDNPTAKVLLLYKLLNNPVLNDRMKSLLKQLDNRIIVPESFDDLKNSINNIWEDNRIDG
jgi:hypothetical protein